MSGATDITCSVFMISQYKMPVKWKAFAKNRALRMEIYVAFYNGSKSLLYTVIVMWMKF